MTLMVNVCDCLTKSRIFVLRANCPDVRPRSCYLSREFEQFCTR